MEFFPPNALDERPGRAAIAIDIELEPHRPGRRRDDLLDRGVGQRRQDHQRAGIARRADGRELGCG